jgi:hypothetical protein
VVAEVRQSLPISKQAMRKFDMERFSLKNLYEVEDKEQHQSKISKRFAALENLDDEVDINRSWETIREIPKFRLKIV